MTNPEERIVQPGHEKTVPRTPDEFASAWKFSQEREQLIRDIAAFENESPIKGPEYEKLKAAQQLRQASLT